MKELLSLGIMLVRDMDRQIKARKPDIIVNKLQDGYRFGYPYKAPTSVKKMTWIVFNSDIWGTRANSKAPRKKKQ